MISVSNVTMRYGAKLLFEDVTTAFTPGKRYGLTGPNGSGKSTFMKVLTGELDGQKGTVARPKKLGVLSRDQFAFDAFRVIDTVIMGNKPLWAAMEERERIYAKPEMTNADGMRLEMRLTYELCKVSTVRIARRGAVGERSSVPRCSKCI